MKRKLSILISLAVLLGIFAGCDEKKEEIFVDNSCLDINFNDYKDSEDIPDWTGEKIDVTVWMDANSPKTYVDTPKSYDDVVSGEIERITGVAFDYDKSFDNGGNSFGSKLIQVTASGDYPAMAYSLPELSDLINSDSLYNLAPYIEKYCPNIMKYYGPDTTYGSIWESQKERYGGLYALQIGHLTTDIERMVKDDKSYNLTDKQILSIEGPGDSPHGYIYVRDDILKMIYPEAHTNEELLAIYKKNGKFTKDEIFDVPWDSPKDFIDFLYKVDSLDIPDDGKGEIYTTFTHTGTDNWPACTTMLPMFGYSGDYFDYYDIEEQKIKYTFKEEWFKNILKIYNQLIRDGVASEEALLDTQEKFKEKYYNARYLVALSVEPPILDSDSEYSYRKVYARYTNGFEKCLNSSGGTDGSIKKLSFFKKGLTEKELIQVLRAVDFQCSLPGQKLTFWGPKSAGLYTEDENGKLQYTNEKLKNQMLDTDTYGYDLIEKYGLREGASPGRPVCYSSPYNPYAHYDRPITVELQFNAAYVDPITYPVYSNANFYNEGVVERFKGTKKFWQARSSFEDALAQIFASTSDEEFKERYDAMCSLAEQNGLTDETLEEYQRFFDKVNKVNKDNIEAFLNENAY